MTFPCVCGRNFAKNGGYQKHQKSCLRVKEANADLLCKRKASEDSRKISKIPRVSYDDVSESQASPSDLDSIEPLSSQTLPMPEFDAEAIIPDIRPSGRPNRRRRFPRIFKDFLPSGLTRAGAVPDTYQPPPKSTPLPPLVPPSSPNQSSSPTQAVPVASATYSRSEPNMFGLFRTYLRVPTIDPELSTSIDTLADSTTHAVPKPDRSRWWKSFGRPGYQTGKRHKSGSKSGPFAPFLNASVFRLMSWFYSGSNIKSEGELDRLVNEVLLQDDFDREDLRGFRASAEIQRLDEWEDIEAEDTFRAEDGWQEASIRIHVPAENVKFASESVAPEYEIKGLYYRRLIEVVKAAFQDKSALNYHLAPFRLFCQDDPSVPTSDTTFTQVYSEIFNSEAMNEEFTQLAQFGSASLWPVYGYFGNQTKYERGKPSSFAAHHLAYLPTLPDEFQDWYKARFNKAASAATIRLCKRELMHNVWLLLLDDEFMKAYEHGIIIRFADGIERLVFPRFFTYSADYPEKVLLATIRYLASCPCPRCFVRKNQISTLGTKYDMARRETFRTDSGPRRYSVNLTRSWIFERGYGPESSRIRDVLDDNSWVPTKNAFSTRLSKFDFNFYKLFAPDLLHEFELGVWKATFTHLLRILYAAGDDKIQELNRRYRLVPTFGRGTIRRFHRNTSAMKKLAARDWEDILQVAMPVFDGLLPASHNRIVMDLLFALSTWHALAKLRMHTDATLDLLSEATTELGRLLRQFNSKVCSEYETRELPSEEAARGRRKAALVKKGQQSVHTKQAKNSPGRRLKTFNLSTYKLHALGDYVHYIRFYGTSENYSTQIGELEHRRVKRFYARTNKNRFTHQIAMQQRRADILRKLRERNLKQTRKKAVSANSNGICANATQGSSNHNGTLPQKPTTTLSFEESESLSYTSPQAHHHISPSSRYHEDLSVWLHEHTSDPALKNFIPKLRDHILARLSTSLDDEDTPTFSGRDRASIRFSNNRIYRHKVLRVNYTSYDLRRDQDSLNARTHPDFMILDPSQTQLTNNTPRHPYKFGRIIGVFHVFARRDTMDPEPQHLEFLFVRWFTSVVPGQRLRWNPRRLPQVQFLPGDDPNAFGFLDPGEVIRAVHLVPAFASGFTSDLLGPSIARSEIEHDTDYKIYYVNIFVDRDMYMRFRGGGIGHRKVTPVTQNMDTQPEPREGPDEVENDLNEDPPGQGERPVVIPSEILNTDLESPEVEEGVEAGEGALSDEEIDYGYKENDIEEVEEEAGSEDGDEDIDDAELGPEDGEEEGAEDMQEYGEFAQP